MTADRRLFKAGDTDYGFAIESISKVFTLALVTEIIGSETGWPEVGVSPNGLPFNSVMALELRSGKPLSPLVNARAAWRYPISESSPINPAHNFQLRRRRTAGVVKLRPRASGASMHLLAVRNAC
jgi:glutaminase